MMEERCNEAVVAFEFDHAQPDLVVEIILVVGYSFTGDGLLEVVVEILIRVQFRAIGGQVDQFDALAVLFQPFLDRAAVVDPQVVDDEDDFCASAP